MSGWPARWPAGWRARTSRCCTPTPPRCRSRMASSPRRRLFTMLHHVPSAALQDRMLAELRRVLRPGGLLAGTDGVETPARRDLHVDDDYLPIDPATMADRLAAAGFRPRHGRGGGGPFRFAATAPGAGRREPGPDLRTRAYLRNTAMARYWQVGARADVHVEHLVVPEHRRVRVRAAPVVGQGARRCRAGRPRASAPRPPARRGSRPRAGPARPPSPGRGTSRRPAVLARPSRPGGCRPRSRSAPTTR